MLLSLQKMHQHVTSLCTFVSGFVTIECINLITVKMSQQQGNWMIEWYTICFQKYKETLWRLISCCMCSGNKVLEHFIYTTLLIIVFSIILFWFVRCLLLAVFLNFFKNYVFLPFTTLASNLVFTPFLEKWG